MNKKNELKNRIYDIGISPQTMPSVNRPMQFHASQAALQGPLFKPDVTGSRGYSSQRESAFKPQPDPKSGL